MTLPTKGDASATATVNFVDGAYPAETLPVHALPEQPLDDTEQQQQQHYHHQALPLDDVQQASQDTVVNPLIFQCRQCRHVLGDSFAWLSADEELNALTLSTVCGSSVKVEMGEGVRFKGDGVDAGSAYVTLACRHCGVTLGKSYRATPRRWDHLRDVYTLDLEAITSYQLGAANDADGLSSGHDALAALPSMPSALELRTALAKLDAGIVRLGERMKVVERAVASGRELASQKVPTTVVDRASQNKATGAPHNKAGPTTERAFQKNSGTAPAVHKSNKRAMTAGTSTVAHVETKPVQKRRLSKT